MQQETAQSFTVTGEAATRAVRPDVPVDAGPSSAVLDAAPLPDDFQTILTGIAAGVTVEDERGRLLFANDDAAQLVGFASSAEMLATPAADLIARCEVIDEHGRRFDLSRLPGPRVLAGERVEPVLVGFRSATGDGERWSKILARTATLADGRRVAVNTFHDVTRTFAEIGALRDASAVENAQLFREGVRFKRLLDATGDAILMLDPREGRIGYANRGAAEQLERAVDDLVGSSIDTFLDPVGVAKLAEAMASLSDGTAGARTVMVEFRRPGGTTLPVEVRLEYAAPDGAPAQVLAIARDIRDRIRAQVHLRGLAASEHARAAELNAVIRAMGDGVFVCDQGGKIILANPAAIDTFPDIDETTYREILDQLDDPDGLAPALGDRGGPVELRVKSGDERWIEISTSPVAAGREGVTGPADESIVLLRDVTEARQRQAVRDTFIGVLSHELRTPVTTIYAGAKVLARPAGLPDDTRQAILDDIVVESERLHRLVEDVIAMTRFGDDAGDVGAEPVLLQRLLPPVVESERGRWPGVAFEADVPVGLPTVVADPTYVEQVVRNLLSNAAKYGGSGTAVTTIADRADDEVLVRILDDGPGFPADEVDRLFDLFFRSAQTARAAPGAGIGLFVCARLIKAMGGRIWAANRAEGGAEFGFALRVMNDD